MDELKRLLLTNAKRLRQSIAFLPVPLISGAILLGFLLFRLEQATDVSGWLAERLPALAITSQDTARTTLGLFVGGLITLTVFAFSQIMVLLNQVAGSYSPRILPRLTGDRALQFVMGFYLATIVLILTVLLSIRSDDSFRIPNFSIFLCVIFGVSCLCLFVYFVSTVSRRIQVDSIIRRLADSCSQHLDRATDGEGYGRLPAPPDVLRWPAIPTPIAGYLGSVDHDRLSKLAAELGTRFYIGTTKGRFVPRNFPLLQSEKKLDEEDVKRVLAVVSPVPEAFSDWYLPDFAQLTEIALRALSPGINDPATAVDVIDHQSDLLHQLLTTPLPNHFRRADGSGGHVHFAAVGFCHILTDTLQQLRAYGHKDPIIGRRLVVLLYHLLSRAEATRRPGAVGCVREELRALVFDLNRGLANPRDRAVVSRDIRHHRLRRQLV